MKLFPIAILIGVLSVPLSDAEEQCSEAQSQLSAMKSAFDVCTNLIKKTGEKKSPKPKVPVDWCEVEKKSCPKGRHPKCNKDGSINKNRSGKSLPFNKNQQEWMKYKMNQYKNDICSGAVLNYGKCSRNCILDWSDQLADIAQAATEYCDFGKKFDACFSADISRPVGRLVWKIKIDSKGITNEKWQELIDMLVEGYKRDDMSNINMFNHTSSSKGYTEGVTTLMASGTTTFGCGSALCGLDWIVACVFAPLDNYIGNPVYLSADTAATGCVTGPDKRWSSLCSPLENSLLTPELY